MLSFVIVAVLLLKGFMDKKTAQDDNVSLKATEQRYLESERIYNQYAAVLQFYQETLTGEGMTVRNTDNIVAFLEELEQKMPANMTISEFTSNDSTFSMDCRVEDKNAAIGIIETLRTFDSLENVSIGGINEVYEVLEPDDYKDLLKDVEEASDEEDSDKKEDAEDTEINPATEISKEDEERGFSIASIYKYTVKVDPVSGEEYVVKSYVEFSVTCTYTPVETVTVHNNVEQ